MDYSQRKQYTVLWWTKIILLTWNRCRNCTGCEIIERNTDSQSSNNCPLRTLKIIDCSFTSGLHFLKAFTLCWNGNSWGTQAITCKGKIGLFCELRKLDVQTISPAESTRDDGRTFLKKRIRITPRVAVVKWRYDWLEMAIVSFQTEEELEWRDETLSRMKVARDNNEVEESISVSWEGEKRNEFVERKRRRLTRREKTTALVGLAVNF